MNENEEVVVNRKEVKENSEESYEDSRRVITRTARFSMNEEAAVRKKMKSCNEEPLLVKLEKGNNLRIFCYREEQNQAIERRQQKERENTNTSEDKISSSAKEEIKNLKKDLKYIKETLKTIISQQ